MSYFEPEQKKLTRGDCLDAISNTIEQRDKYKKALVVIKKHLEKLAGDMVGQSAIYMIASKALDE